MSNYEREARRLRAEFIASGVESAVVALDRFTRRVACRIAARLFGWDCFAP
jgi:hypothetical protein